MDSTDPDTYPHWWDMVARLYGEMWAQAVSHPNSGLREALLIHHGIRDWVYSHPNTEEPTSE